MSNGLPENSQAPPDASGVFFLAERVKALGEPVFARFAERLGAGDEARILAAVTKVPRRDTTMTPEAVQEIICRELFTLVLSRQVRALGLSAEEVDRDLARSRAQLDGLGDGSNPKRVYYTVSALHRCATRAQEREVIEVSCRALEMPRNRVDVYKRRAIQRLTAATCFASTGGHGARELLGELHLFFLDLDPSLRAASSALLDAHCHRGSAVSAARTVEAHQRRNRHRKVYDQRCKEAKRLWTTHLPEALDASSMRPFDAEDELATELRGAGLAPEQIAARILARWHALRISWSVPQRILPTTTWLRILSATDRPPTWVLEGEWQQLVRGRGLLVEHAWRCLVDAARQADAAHAAWTQAAEDSLSATQDDPAPLKAAIKQFNRSLDELLTRPAGVRVVR